MACKFLPQLSAQSSSDESVVSTEIELLTNIYDGNELIVNECDGIVTLDIHITPRTADNSDQQFVYVNITMELNKQYPLLPPVTKITSSRGLSDAHISSIHSDMQVMADERVGGPMLFDLLEHVKDCLTDQNKPCGSCSICLCVFEEGDSFTRTECYHYFHINCFARYVRHLEQVDDNVDGIPWQPQMLHAQSNCVKCPVCRVSLSENSSCFYAISDPTIISNIDEDKDIIYHPSEADLERMKEWQCIMEKQRSQGGIIDHSVDPHLVDWNWTPTPTEQPVTMDTDNTVVPTPITTADSLLPIATTTTVTTPKSTATTHYYRRPRTQHNYHKKARHKHY